MDNLFLTWDSEGECWFHTSAPVFHPSVSSWWSQDGHMIRVESMDNSSLSFQCKKVTEMIHVDWEEAFTEELDIYDDDVECGDDW
jgi:hypothetical protein